MKSTLIKTMLILSMLTATFQSCGLKGIPVPPDKQDYVGMWASSEMQLSISKGGRVEYKRSSGSGSKSISAPIQKFVGNNFVVGALGINTTFVVSELPHQDSTGIWKMTVDGVELTKIAD